MDILVVSVIVMSIVSLILFGYIVIKLFLLWKELKKYRKGYDLSTNEIDNYLLIDRLKEK